MLLVVAGERGIGRREIEDIGLEGRHGTFSCWERKKEDDQWGTKSRHSIGGPDDMGRTDPH
jgi:hypothetical protein